jgi:3-methylfumaryl-CoA hydratase
MTGGAPLAEWVGAREVREEVIAEFPAQAAAAMLDRAATGLAAGGALPALWHWFYFLPRASRSELDQDGHPKRGGFLPPVPLPRRMFAGARTQVLAPITIGAPAVREGEILAVRETTGKSGRLVFVTVRYRISQEGMLRVEEEQDIVYREPGPPMAAPEPLSSPPEAPPGAWVSDISPDPVLLFRFSALTFNAHRIHYDLPYAREVEGYPGLVVHGPLTAILLAAMAEARSARRVSRFAFQGRAPLFALHPFRLVGQAEGTSVTLDALGPDGGVALHATAELD